MGDTADKDVELQVLGQTPNGKFDGVEKQQVSQNYNSSVILTKDLFQMSQNEMITEIWRVTKSAISVGIGILLSILFLSINLHFAGQLQNKSILAGIGLGNVMINCTGYFLVLGLNQGFGSLSARAFSSKSSALQQNYYTKGIFTVVFVSIFMLCFMIFLEDILILLGQDKDVSFYAAQYGLGITFGLVCLFFFDCIRNYFNSMGIYTEPMYVQIISIITQYVFCAIFCNGMELGLTGVILGTNVNYFCLLVMAYYLAKKKQVNLLPEFDKQAIFVNYKRYISFCMPIALPMVVDIFGFEINSLLIGSMKLEDQFSAHVIMCNMASLFYSFPLGLCGALCTMISNAVGENDYVKARNYWKISYFSGIGFGCCSTFLFVFFKRELGYLFSPDENIVDQFVKIMMIFQFVIGFDYLQGSQQGIMKGVGQGKLCLYLFVFSFYIVGTSSSCILGFGYDLQLVGFWIGFVFAILTVFTLQTIAMCRIVWPKQIQEQHDNLLLDKKILDQLSEEMLSLVAHAK